jgi:MoxR-like ATPase
MAAEPHLIPLAPARSKLAELETALEGALRGKREVVRLSLVCLFARGHLLVEDVPGVGKTTLAQALARCVECDFQRLQFTADMLPSDVVGVTVYNARTGEFEFKRGPIFTNFLLADEINRSTPRTQSALLEAMNEAQVSVDGKTHLLKAPFLVIATQNPVEHHGTYPLPESQLDRFLLRLQIGYPDRLSEREIVRQQRGAAVAELKPILTGADVIRFQEQAARVRVDDSLVDYLLAIAERTRNHEGLALGVSPRGAQALYRAAQALAMIEGRDYVLPDDIKRLAVPVFAHRVAVEAKMVLAQRSIEAASRILEQILTHIDVPI